VLADWAGPLSPCIFLDRTVLMRQDAILVLVSSKDNDFWSLGLLLLPGPKNSRTQEELKETYYTTRYNIIYSPSKRFQNLRFLTS